MLSRIYLIVFVILLFASSFVYFSSNTSYKNSFEARVYYFLGNYEQAQHFAQLAYDQDKYNKMAFTVLTQSKIARTYENYIKQGNIYLAKIDAISSKESFTKADKIRVKMMCEVMIDSYDSLVPTALTDEELKQTSKVVYMKFKKLFDELY